jgi:hypothetical protein
MDHKRLGCDNLAHEQCDPVNEAQEADFFIYLFCHDFQKINGRIKIF